MRPSSTRAPHGLGLCRVSRGARVNLGPCPSDATSPRSRGSHQPGHATILQRLFPCQGCAWMAAACARSLHDSTGPLLSRVEPTEKPQPGLRGRLRVAASVHGGRNGGHLKAKAGPSGLLRPEAAGLRKNTRPSPGGDRPWTSSQTWMSRGLNGPGRR